LKAEDLEVGSGGLEMVAGGRVLRVSFELLGLVDSDVLRGTVAIWLFLLILLAKLVGKHLVQLRGRVSLSRLLGLRLRANLAPGLLAHDALSDREV
jgi:hypothetical protein